MQKYNFIFQRVEYPQERGYRMESRKLPDWIYLTVSTENGSKVLRVHSRIHINKEVKVLPVYSTKFSDSDIIKELSGEISYRFL